MSHGNRLSVGLILPHGKFAVQNAPMAGFLEDFPEAFRPWMIPSCGLLTVAALSPDYVDCEYVDEQVRQVDFDAGYDIVAISGMTQHASRAYAIAAGFRQRGVYTVMGGAHATVMEQEVAQHVDTVVAGEAEGTWRQFISDFRAGRPKPVYRNFALDRIDLTASPVPRYDLLGDDYFSLGRGYRMLPVQTTRGCPRSCDFCSVPQIYGKVFRKKSVEQIVAEVEAARAAAPNQLFLFADDNMFINRRFSRELLKALIPLRIRYLAQSDIGIAKDEELLQLMYQSGCTMVLVGLESLSPDNLRGIDRFKSKMLGNYHHYVKRIQDNGMIVLGAFIVGFDHDDLSVFERIREFVLETQITPQLTIATPLPATAMTRRLTEQGRLPDYSYWDQCTYYDAIYEPALMTGAQVEAGLAQLHRSLFDPAVVARRRGYYRRALRSLPRRYTAGSVPPAAGALKPGFSMG